MSRWFKKKKVHLIDQMANLPNIQGAPEIRQKD